MLRRKRYLLADEGDDIKIPRSTVSYRRKSEITEARNSISGHSIANEENCLVSIDSSNFNAPLPIENNSCLLNTDSVLTHHDTPSPTTINSTAEFETLMLFAMTKHGWTHDAGLLPLPF